MYTLCLDRMMFICKVFICSYTYFPEALIAKPRPRKVKPTWLGCSIITMAEK